MTERVIRVLVVDDSAFLRKAISEMLHRDPEIQVVGTARDGLDALEKIDELQPDVLTVDLHMPNMDGVDLLRAIRGRGLPVVVVSSVGETGEKAMAAVEAGAVDFVQKPTRMASHQVMDIAADLVCKVKAAADLSHSRLANFEALPSALRLVVAARQTVVDAVVIGISTGGPQALRLLLPQLPVNFPVPVAVVLHMPRGYTGPYAQRLDEMSAVEVKEAAEGDAMRPGRVVVGQAGRHLWLQQSVTGEVFCQLRDKPVATHHPAVDVLFQSAAEAYGKRVLGVVMTGMGQDGTVGSAVIKAHGGIIFTEAEISCVVYGMPRSVVEAGLSDRVYPLESMGAAIVHAVTATL